jgi:hypothetical protein
MYCANTDTGLVSDMRDFPGLGMVIGAEKGFFLARAVDGAIAIAPVTEAISTPGSDRCSCQRAREAEQEEQESYRLETDHRSTRSVAQRRQRKTTVVCAAVENRDVSQGSEVWLQSGRVQAADC